MGVVVPDVLSPNECHLFPRQQALLEPRPGAVRALNLQGLRAGTLRSKIPCIPAHGQPDEV